MKLQHLNVFVAAADLCHMTRAARRLGITQSAASAAVAGLEADLGVKLFHRVNRRIELTAAGRTFLPEAQAVLDRAEAARAALRESVESPVGEVRLSASQTIANYWLPLRLASLRRTYPGIDLSVRIGNSASVERDVVRGRVDLGLAEAATREDQLIRRVVARDQPVLVAAAAEEITDMIEDRPDPRALPWVVREPGSGTRELLDRYCREVGVAPREITIALELPSNESVREAVEAGAGVTIISTHVVRGGIASGALKAVPIDLEDREFVLLRHSERTPTFAQRLVADGLTARDG